MYKQLDAPAMQNSNFYNVYKHYFRVTTHFLTAYSSVDLIIIHLEPFLRF